jgi:competence protein ComEC
VRSGTIAFACGVLALCQLAVLPDPFLVELLPVALLLAAARPRGRLAALATAGFLWAVLRAGLILSGDLPPRLEGADLLLQGTVGSLPVRDGVRVRFRFLPERVRSPPDTWRAPGPLRLSWYGDAPDLRPGDRWLLTVRLKRPHGFMNPGGFDYERWLFGQHVRATGYVRAGAPHRYLGPARGHTVARLRARLAAHIDAALAGHPQHGVVKALAIGARDGIAERQWAVFRATGTGHLMAISGLHVGLVAAIAFWLGRVLWSVPGRTVAFVAAPRVGAVAGLLAALAYAALAGFSVPTQRALVMVGVVMAALLWRRSIQPTVSLAWASLLVLVLDPLAVLAPGFWLSFGAVAVILFGMCARIEARGLWWRWGRVQCLVALGLMPLTLVLFGEHPLVSPLANLIAVPWTGLVVVPLTLAGTALAPFAPAASAAVLSWAGDAAQLVWPLLTRLAELGLVYRAPAAPEPWALAAAGLGVAWLLLPRGAPARWVGGLWLLPLLLSAPPRPVPGAMAITLLDVGQGLAVVIRTHGHVLLFDAGPRYGAHFDAGRAAIVPFLRHHGVTAVDRFILSHGDADHAGGARSVLGGMRVGEVISNDVEAISGQTPAGTAAVPCRVGLRWHWDGIDFRILHPPAGYRGSDNEGSCVLRASGPGGSVLVPGDIEGEAEARLVRVYGPALASDVLIVPHHGSATSSTETFLDAARPRLALLAVGYRNRFKLPNAGVMGRYRARGVPVHATAREGALTVVLAPGHAPGPPRSHRARVRRFWHWTPADTE